MTVKLRRGLENGSRACLSVGPRLVDAGAASLTLHPRSAKQMYTGAADHALTAELVSLVDVPVVASGDITSRARAQAVLGRRQVRRPSWSAAPRRESVGVAGDPRRATASSRRARVVAELVLFMRETVRELGEHRATGFLKKFYGWYLGRGRFPRAFKAELTQLPTISRGRGPPLRSRVPGPASSCTARGELPAGRRGSPRPADLDLRRRLTGRASPPRRRAGTVRAGLVPKNVHGSLPFQGQIPWRGQSLSVAFPDQP